MKICFFGKYQTDYARNTVIRNALTKQGMQVSECHSQSKLLIRAVKLFFCALKKEFDILWVGYPGYTDVFIAKAVCLIKRKPLVFDVFASIYESEYEYGTTLKGKEIIKEYRPIKDTNSFYAKYLRFLDKYSCKLADKIFMDTPQQIDYFAKKYSIPKNKFDWFFVGANEKIFHQKKAKKQKEKFTVLYYGRTTPVHGLEKIMKAAEMLSQNKNIQFVLIGENIHFRLLAEKYSKLENCTFKKPVSLTQLSEEIAKADVCLGIFGDSAKGMRAIPNKVFEPLAMKKAVITMHSPIMDSVFTNLKNIILCNNTVEDIKKSILLLKNDSNLKEKIAENGHALFEKQFSEEVIGLKIKKILEKMQE